MLMELPFGNQLVSAIENAVIYYAIKRIITIPFQKTVIITCELKKRLYLGEDIV